MKRYDLVQSRHYCGLAVNEGGRYVEFNDAKSALDESEKANEKLRHDLAKRDEEIAEGYQIVPKNPTEAMWGGLARDLMMWLDLNRRPTANSLREHMRIIEREIPPWMEAEGEMHGGDHVISKGTRAVLIYKAFLHEAEKEPK